MELTESPEHAYAYSRSEKKTTYLAVCLLVDRSNEIVFLYRL